MKEIEDKLLESLKDKVIDTVDTKSLEQHLLSARISPTEAIPEPPVCLQVIENGATKDVCTLGNFSLAIGKAKSRKTFLVTLFFAVVTGYITNKFSGGLPLGKKVGIYFDTEQSRFHVQKLLHRICKLVGTSIPENVIVYSLRKYRPEDRLEMINYAINNTPNLGFVVIDGIRDLVTSINDEEQATSITSFLLNWTEERNIHIMTVLHQNKNDNNARGHLGTELTNKAETVLSIAKYKEDGSISTVEPEYCRDKEFEPFAFTINIDELPEIVEGQKKQLNGKKNIIQDLGDRNIYTLLSECFSKDSNIKYSDLKVRVKVAAASLFKKDFGLNKSVEILTYSKSKSWVIQEKDLAPYTLGKFD